MKKVSSLLILLLFFNTSSILSAQNRQISLEEIYDGTFSTQSLEKLRSMKNGKQYTILTFDRAAKTSSIEKYDYKTQKKVETILSSSKTIPYFTSYEIWT